MLCDRYLGYDVPRRRMKQIEVLEFTESQTPRTAITKLIQHMTTTINQVFVAAVLIGATSIAAAAAGPWVKTFSGPDSDETGTSLHTEYVLPTSVKLIQGNYRTAFMKVTWDPGVRGFDGDVMTTLIAETMINCNDLSWGNVSEMYFDKSMKPIMSSTGDFDRSKSVWTIKDMKKLRPSDFTYRTAQYICGIVVHDAY